MREVCEGDIAPRGFASDVATGNAYARKVGLLRAHDHNSVTAGLQLSSFLALPTRMAFRPTAGFVTAHVQSTKLPKGLHPQITTLNCLCIHRDALVFSLYETDHLLCRLACCAFSTTRLHTHIRTTVLDWQHIFESASLTTFFHDQLNNGTC